MCQLVERENFELDKKRGLEAVMKTYDLFGLKRPTKVVWCKDIFDKKFEDSAWSAGSARNAWSAGSVWSARSARSAWSAGSAGSVWSAGWTALDDDFDWFVMEHEYILNPDKECPINNNDRKYLEYSKLLMEAMEYGIGYRVEWEDTLYLVPTPLVKIDERNRFHSTKAPAIRWKGGAEFYYFSGVNFEKDLWTKIVKNKLSAEYILTKIENVEQRRIAWELMDKSKIKKLKGLKVLDRQKDGKGKVMRIITFTVKGFDTPFYFYEGIDASTSRKYYLETDKKTVWEAKAGFVGFSPDEIEYKNEY